MPYTSEELNGNFYQDNNNYTEIGELHASSKQAVVGRVDSRYKNTKKISLQAPDSDRLIYNFASESKIVDMAIRYAFDNVNEKMMFVGKDFLSVYDSETGNFILREPHEVLKNLINPYDNKIDAGLGKLSNENETRLSYEQLDFVCKSMKYTLSAEKYFFIISELDNGHSVIWKMDPDTMRISKSRPKDFYDGPGAETILAKPFIHNSVIYVFTKTDANKVRLWSCNINDTDANAHFTYDDSLADETNGIGEVVAGSFGYVIDDVNGETVVKAFNINGGFAAVHFPIGQVNNAVKYLLDNTDDLAEDYQNTTIKMVKLVKLSNNVHILMLLRNGIIKVLDNGYSQNAIRVVTRRTENNTYVSFVKYYEDSLDGENHNYPVLKLFNAAGKSKALLNSGTTSYATLGTSGNTVIDSTAFTVTDDLYGAYGNGFDILGYTEYDDTKTIIFGWFNENGIVKPLIKEYDSNRLGYSVTQPADDEEEENIRPFRAGLEPDSAISIVKNIPFGNTKAIRVSLKPDVGSETRNDEEIYFRESEGGNADGKYTTGSVLWSALKESGIPFNTQVKSIGRIILDGYDIPIESVLITRPDENTDFGSVLLSFDKLFDITSLDEKYLKLGNVLYPGILFRNNKGFLNDAMISNVYTIDSTFAYDDASNGNLLDDLSLSIKAAVVLNLDNPILIIAANNGKLSSININTGSYITSDGVEYGEEAPNITSANINDYNYVTDGEIVKMVKANNKPSFYILYASGKIIEYDYTTDAVTVRTSPVTTVSDGKDVDTVATVRNDTLVYFINDGTKKVGFFDLDSNETDGVNANDDITLPSSASYYINVGDDFYFISSANKLIKFNPHSGTCTVVTTDLPTDAKYLAWDFADRIYVASDTTLKYVDLTTGSVQLKALTDIAYNGFLVYYNKHLYTLNADKYVAAIAEDDTITVVSDSAVTGDIIRTSCIDFTTGGCRILLQTHANDTISLVKIAISNSGTTTGSVTIETLGTVQYDTTKATSLLDGTLKFNAFFNGDDVTFLKEVANQSISVGDVFGTDITALASENAPLLAATDEFIGFANGVLVFKKDGFVFTHDPRKTLQNYVNKYCAHKATLRTSNTNPVTAIGFADNGNVLAVCFGDGAIESIYLPEYNGSDGYYASDYGEIIEDYARTVYVRTEVAEATAVGDLTRPAKTGYSFIGWSSQPDEDHYYPVTNTDGTTVEIAAGSIIYAVYKDNHEEYVDRAATRLYAKAGEFLNTGVVEINQVGNDVVFQTTEKSIRWANEVGIFFEENSGKYVGTDNSISKGVYNHGVLASKLYLNGAASVKIGDYIYYINGYNPSAANPQTTVHNGIVIYDTKNDEYAVMSKGTDHLHGTILSRIHAFAFYHSGYIYIFGGLERRDIHVSGDAYNNNYSRFHRTNKIEKIDVRTGERVVLNATFGPGDRYVDDDTTKSLVFAGETEVRNLYYDEENNKLVGIINIEEYNEKYEYEFDLSNDTATCSKIGDFDSTFVTQLSEDIVVTREGENLIISNSAKSTILAVKVGENGADISEIRNGFGFVKTAHRFIVFNEALDKIPIDTRFNEDISSNSNGFNYYVKQAHATFRVVKQFVFDDTVIIDNSPAILHNLQDPYSYAYSKSVFKAFSSLSAEEKTLVVPTEFTGTFKAVGDKMFAFDITSGALAIRCDGELVTRVDVDGTVAKVLYGEDDIFTCIVLDATDKITNIVSYNIDKQIAVNRSVSSNYEGAIVDQHFFLDKISKKIFGIGENGIVAISGIDVNSVDTNASVNVVFSSRLHTYCGFGSYDNSHILAYHFIKDANEKPIKLGIDIEGFDDITNSLVTASSSEIDINVGSDGILHNVNGQLIIVKHDNVTFIDDSVSSETVKLSDGDSIYDLEEDAVIVRNDNKLVKRSRSFLRKLASTNAFRINHSGNFSRSTAHICQNDECVFTVADNSVVTILDKTKKTTSRIEGIIDPATAKIVGIAADDSALYLFDASIGKILKYDLAKKVITKKITLGNLTDIANVKVDTVGNTVYFTVEASLYRLRDDEVAFLTSGLTDNNIVSIKYISHNNSIKFVTVNNTNNITKVNEVNLDTLVIGEATNLSIQAPNTTIIAYSNIGERQFATNVAIDSYGNLIIVGGSKTGYDNNPTHITTIEGFHYTDFVETVGVQNSKNLALRAIVDDKNIYAIGISANGEVDLVVTKRNETSYKGAASFSVGSAEDHKRYFVCNNELFGLDISTSTFRVLKYNTASGEFVNHSTEPIAKTGVFVSCNAYSDGTLYAIFLTTTGGEIKFNLVCYNLNTKKAITNITETVYSSLNSNIGESLQVLENSSWNGKYFTTILGTGVGSDAILVTVNVLKSEHIVMLGRTISPSGRSSNRTATYFNDRLYSFGTDNTVYKTKLTDSEINVTESIATAVGKVSTSSGTVLTGNRMLVTGIYGKPLEMNRVSRRLFNSDANVKQANPNANRFIVLPNNEIAIGNNEYTSSEKPMKFDIIKSPIKSFEFNDTIAVKIFSGINEDTIVTYNRYTGEIVDNVNISRDYGSAIQDLFKFDTNSYLVIHSDTPRISTLVIHDNGNISFKRYDGVGFGEAINTGTNIHTIQEVDLTMLFDSEMDEFDIRQSNAE